MDPDTLLFWLSLLLPLGGLLRATRGGWTVLCGALLTGDLAAQALAPERTATVSLVVMALWAVFVALPNGLLRLVARAAARQDHVRASRLALAAAILHPLDGCPRQAALFQALALARRGRWDLAEPRLRAFADGGGETTLRLSALAHLCQWSGDWRPLTDGPPPADNDILATLMRVRALGESGRPDEMLRLFDAASPRFRRSPYWEYARMAAFAFGGRPHAVAILGRTTLAMLPAEAIALWEAIARMAAGGPDAEAGRAAMERLTHVGIPGIARAASLRMANPPREATALAPDLRVVLDRAEGDLTAARTPRVRFDPSRIRVTLGLIAVLLGVFALEVAAGGSENDAVLFRLGAMWPPAVLGEGQWWRLAAALFLHAGPIHLALNLVGLLFLGLIAEPMFGRFRFLLMYVLTGLGSMASVLVLMRLQWAEPGLLVGASGALMGLAGAIVAALASRVRGTAIDGMADRMRAGAFLLILQFAIDLTTPRISFAAHVSGFVIGALIGLSPWARRGVTTPVSFPTSGRPSDQPSAAASGTAVFRRGFGVYVFLGGVFGSAIWLRGRPRSESPVSEPVIELTPPVVAALRRLRFVFVDVEAGAPMVDPEAPFGSPDALADLAPLADARGTRMLYAATMGSLPLFCDKAALAPGRYVLTPRMVAGLNRLLPPGRPPVAPDGAFVFRREHALLIPALSWRVMDARTWNAGPVDPRALPPAPGDTWPVAAVNFKRPYGDLTYFEADMADALGIPFGRDEPPREALDRLDRLHNEMHAALQVFVLYATMPSVRGAAPR